MSGYNESTNSIEKSIVITVEGNYTAAEMDANPQLAEQAEIDVTFESQNGQIIYSNTLNSDNYNNTSAARIATAAGPFGCYGDCILSGGHTFSGWTFHYTNLFVSALGIGASTVFSAVATFGTSLAIHGGCVWGCLASWLWFDVFGF
jgi:hypothetical protein